MTINDLIRDEKLQYEAKYTYFPLGKSFWKTNKNKWRSSAKTSWGLKHLKQKNKQKQLKINQVIKIINQ